MSFTDHFYQRGYWETIEKVAGRKDNEEGMSTGAKLGLGALGAAGLGAGAYYSPDIMKYLGEKASTYGDKALGATAQDGIKDVGGFKEDILRSLGHMGRNAGDALTGGSEWAQSSIQDPMKAFGQSALSQGQGAYDSTVEGAKAIKAEAEKAWEQNVASKLRGPEQMSGLGGDQKQSIDSILSENVDPRMTDRAAGIMTDEVHPPSAGQTEGYLRHMQNKMQQQFGQ